MVIVYKVELGIIYSVSLVWLLTALVHDVVSTTYNLDIPHPGELV